jgi:hypothetical protein
LTRNKFAFGSLNFSFLYYLSLGSNGSVEAVDWTLGTGRVLEKEQGRAPNTCSFILK